MKNTISLIVKLLCFLLFITACDNESEQVEELPANILTSQAWKVTTNIQDGEDMLLDCEADDRTTFFDDGTLTVEDLGAVCDNESTGTWELSNGGNTLTMIDNSIPIPIVGNIKTLTSDKLDIEGSLNAFGTTISFNIIYEPF